MFTMHTHAPYIRNIKAIDCSDFKDRTPDAWFGYDDYMDELQSQHAAGYKGPFSIGIWCPRTSATALLAGTT